MPSLDRQTIQEITDILTRVALIKDKAGRRALMIEAFGLDYQQLRIDFDGETRVFVLNLIDSLNGYGKIETGIPALAVLLETARQHISPTEADRIDALLLRINPPLPPPAPPTSAVASGATEHEAPIEKVAAPHEAKPNMEVANPVQAEALTEEAPAESTSVDVPISHLTERALKNNRRRNTLLIGLTLVGVLVAVAAAYRSGYLRITRNDLWIPRIEAFDDVEMALVPAGCFMMGSESGEADEKPVHEICFDAPFWIDRYEVTRALYGACVAAGGCTETPPSDYSTAPEQPINRVTWFQAKAYCDWRGVRLPTEAEWEYAARGVSNWRYPWGDEWNAGNVVHSGNSNDQTAPVGSRLRGASWVGALDMSGNVWEWVSSLYLPYPYDEDDGRENTQDTNSPRVLRGGSFGGTADNLRAPDRFRDVPGGAINDFGFRCARDYVEGDLTP